MRRLQITVALVGLVLAVGLTAQTRVDVHPGKVQIRSAASDALSVTGGAGISGALAASEITTTGGLGLHLQGNTPQLWMNDSNAAANNRLSRFASLDGLFVLEHVNDAVTLSTSAVQFTRSAHTALQMLSGPDGSASAPAYAFVNDPDTGVYRAGANELALTAGAKAVLSVFAPSGIPEIGLIGGALGTGGVSGPQVILHNNTSGAGAPGTVDFRDRLDTGHSVWSDSSGNLRIGSRPTESGGDTGGTVVGTQTSTWASKDIFGRETDTEWALDEIRQTPVYRFRYTNGAYNQQDFVGITTTTSPLFGMDDGRVFNPVTSFGVTVLALQELEQQLQELRAEMAALKAERR